MIEKQLPDHHFDNVVRWIKRADVDRLDQLSILFTTALNRLGRKRRIRLAVKGSIPAGSDHFDNGSLSDWLDKVQPEDTEAVVQVVVLDATVQARLRG